MVPTASERGAESEVAHKWARWLHNTCRLGGPLRFRSGGQNQKWPTSGQGGYIVPPRGSPPLQAGGKIRSGPQMGPWLHNPCRLGGPHRFRAGGRILAHKGQGGYITPAAYGVPTASERGAESEVARKWARWLHNPCRLGGPLRFRAGGRNQKLARKWARWLHNPCHLGGPLRFGAGGRIRSGPQVGKVATQPLPPRGSPPLQSGGQNQKWPTSGQGGYITPAA